MLEHKIMIQRKKYAFEVCVQIVLENYENVESYMVDFTDALIIQNVDIAGLSKIR